MSSWINNSSKSKKIYKNNIITTDNSSKTVLDDLITFIIPSINRNTLYRALISLKNQIISNWRAIIIFDGCIPTDTNLIELLSYDRFLYINVDKTGILKDKIHGAAGFVRNIGMSLVKTPWIGFLDDDDYLLPNYTQCLIKEIETTPLVDVVVFRMSDNNRILPPDYSTDIEFGYIGISFCYKTDLFNKGYKFTQSEKEDFDLINNIKNAHNKIVISPFITYIVRDSSVLYNTFKRVIIN